MQIKFYYPFLVILGAISGILAYYGNYGNFYDIFGYGHLRTILFQSTPGILSVILSTILYYKFPLEKDIGIRLRFLVSFLIGFFVFWHGLFIKNALYFRPSMLELPVYLLITLGFALTLSMYNYFVSLLIALVASVIITHGMKNTRKRFLIILGLVILIFWSNGVAGD